jgi:hypothetical protein
MTYDLTCFADNVNYLLTIRCINDNSGGLLAGLLCIVIYALIIMTGIDNDFFADVLLATSFIMLILSGLAWALIGLQWWIVVMNLTVLVISIIYKIWWRNE